MLRSGSMLQFFYFLKGWYFFRAAFRCWDTIARATLLMIREKIYERCLELKESSFGLKISVETKHHLIKIGVLDSDRVTVFTGMSSSKNYVALFKKQIFRLTIVFLYMVKPRDLHSVKVDMIDLMSRIFFPPLGFCCCFLNNFWFFWVG